MLLRSLFLPKGCYAISQRDDGFCQLLTRRMWSDTVSFLVRTVFVCSPVTQSSLPFSFP